MTSRSTIVGVSLAVMLGLVTCNVQAQKQAADERREGSSEIDAGINAHAAQTLA